MAVVDRPDGAERGLTQIKAVDDVYPLIGAVTLDPDMPLDQALGAKGGLPGAVMERALIDRLGWLSETPSALAPRISSSARNWRANRQCGRCVCPWSAHNRVAQQS